MTLPPGMVPYGPDHPDYPNEPRDWDRGLVARRDGSVTSAGTTNAWNHARAGVQDYDLVGYNRTAPVQSDAEIVRESTKTSDPFAVDDHERFARIGLPIAGLLRSAMSFRPLLVAGDAPAQLVDAAFMQAHMIVLADIIAGASADEVQDDLIIRGFVERLRETVAISRLMR